jgi:hypothetical protein
VGRLAEPPAAANAAEEPETAQGTLHVSPGRHGRATARPQGGRVALTAQGGLCTAPYHPPAALPSPHAPPHLHPATPPPPPTPRAQAVGSRIVAPLVMAAGLVFFVQKNGKHLVDAPQLCPHLANTVAAPAPVAVKKAA